MSSPGTEKKEGVSSGGQPREGEEADGANLSLGCRVSQAEVETLLGTLSEVRPLEALDLEKGDSLAAPAIDVAKGSEGLQQENNDQLSQVLSSLQGLNTGDTPATEGTLSFAGRGLKLNDEKDAQELVNAILATENLHTLVLEGNTFGIKASKAIGKALESKPTLVNAHFKDIFTSRLKTEVPEAVRFLCSGIALSGARLFELDLSDNAFGPIGMKAVAPFLQSKACEELRILRLNNNGLGIGGGTLLGPSLSNIKHLQVLVCGRNRLENDASIAIGNALSGLTTLETLEMPQNGIRAEGMETLAKAILSNVNLKVLNLNDNIMTVRGGEAMASALRHAKNIEVINFGDCLLRRQGGIAVLRALKEAGNVSRLKELILTGNELGGEELVSLVVDLFKTEKINKSLKLDMSANNFGADACIEVKKELSKEVNLHLTDDEGSAGEDEEEKEEEEEEKESEPKEEEVEECPKEKPGREVELDEITQILQNEDTSVDKLCELFVNVSIESFNNDEQSLNEKTLQKTELLLESAKKKSRGSFETANSLLTHMGLIKSEENKKAQEKDLRGPFLALSKSVSCLDKTEKDAFQLFVGNRPNKGPDGKFKTKLMQALFL